MDRTEYMRAYRERNRQKLTDQNYAWKKRNPDRVDAYQRAGRTRKRNQLADEKRASYPEVPPDFGHWLAGFIDGEGYFVITRNNRPNAGYRVHFGLSLRDDDLPILQRCIDMTGVGSLHRRPDRPRADKVCRPTAQWFVHAKLDCQRLVEILDRYPLQAKKARDYAIWREAVAAHAEIRPGRPSKGEPPWDWAPLARLREQLIAGRAYDPDRATGH